MSALAEDIELLRESAREWIGERAALTPQRATGLEAERGWRAAIADMGWGGVAIAAEHGGAGLGWSGLGALLSELGRELLPSSLLANSLLSELLQRSDSPLRASLLPALAQGSTCVALAVDEGARHRPQSIITRAVRGDDGWTLDGVKQYVAGGNAADWLIVAAVQADASPAVFLVEAAAVERRPLSMADGRDYAELRFTHSSAQALGDGAALARTLDRARIGTAAEMLGAAERALEITVDYLKLRRQFGQAIGAFQALQHRAARLCVEVELARSCVIEALAAIDRDDDDLPRLAALAKAVAGETLHLASNEIVQLHGGIGMTDDHVAGRYLKYARIAESLYGNTAWLAECYAMLSGF